MIEPVLSIIASDMAKSMVAAADYLHNRRKSAPEVSIATEDAGGELLKEFSLSTQEVDDLVEVLAGEFMVSPQGQRWDDGAIALYRHRELFTTARSRIELVFKIRLGVALLIFVLLVVTILLAIVGLVTGNNGLASGLGSAAVADLLIAGIYKPLDKVADALRDTQRLDMVHAMTEEQLRSCHEQSPAKRFGCQQKVWADALDRLAALEGKSGSSEDS